MTKRAYYNATLIADTGCSSNGVTSRHQFFQVIGYAYRNNPVVHPLEDLSDLKGGAGFLTEEVEKLAQWDKDNLLALVSYGDYLYLNPVRFNEQTSRFELVPGTCAGGNYVTGDSRFDDAASALLREVMPMGAPVPRLRYPLVVHDRIEGWR